MTPLGPEAATLLVQAITTIAVGALSGGITNAVAIWMLFHPYEPVKVGPFTFHGAIPKNKDRLAKSIGKTVGERLLTPEDLGRQLTAPGLREAFERTLDEWVNKALTSEYGPVRELLPPPVTAELEQAIQNLAPQVAERFVEFAATPAFHDAVRDFLARQAAELKDRPVADLLTEARQESIKQWAEGWVDTLAQSEDFERAIREFVERQVDRLAHDPEPLLDRLPTGLVAAVEAGIRAYLPVALERLAGLLARPDLRERVQTTVHGLVQRFTQDLLIHERVIAKLVVSEKTIGRIMDAFERDGAEQIGRLLDEPSMRDQLSRAVNEAVVAFLRKPLREHLGSLNGDRLEGVKRTASDYVLTAMRDPNTRAFAITKLDQALEATERRTWGDLLALLPPDKAADWLQEAARGERVRSWIAEGFAAGGAALLDRRIGQPAALLPEDAPRRIVASLNDPMWGWIKQQVPIVVAQLSVREMVEEKVKGFSIQRMEELIRGVTQRELDLIVRLGYWLGGFVGVVAFLVNFLIARL
ncbi:MAG: DUF445 family protein [Gemmatimonadetes bacterium]|nr:DUF445 family protein [Gemmatimonadota bacterium]